MRWPTTSYKLNFDLHRAGGLWIWAMLLILAWSGVALNLREEAYDPVMSLVFEMESATNRESPSALGHDHVSVKHDHALGEGDWEQQMWN